MNSVFPMELFRVVYEYRIETLFRANVFRTQSIIELKYHNVDCGYVRLRFPIGSCLLHRGKNDISPKRSNILKALMFFCKSR